MNGRLLNLRYLPRYKWIIGHDGLTKADKPPLIWLVVGWMLCFLDERTFCWVYDYSKGIHIDKPIVWFAATRPWSVGSVKDLRIGILSIDTLAEMSKHDLTTSVLTINTGNIRLQIIPSKTDTFLTPGKQWLCGDGMQGMADGKRKKGRPRSQCVPPKKSAHKTTIFFKYENNKIWNKLIWTPSCGTICYVSQDLFLWISEPPLKHYSKFTKGMSKTLLATIRHKDVYSNTCRRWTVARVGLALLLLNGPYLSN